MDKVLFSKNSDNWKTPSLIYEYFWRSNYFDPCPFKSDFDGLKINWKSRNFVNPPYSQIDKWIDKAIEEHKKGNYVVLLIPARTDTKWFRKLVDYGCEIEFVTGRLHFNDSNSAPFPSCYVTLKGNGITICIWRNRFNGE